MTHIAEQWPQNLPMTEENLNEMAKTHSLYVVEGNYAIPIIEDPDAAEWATLGSNASAPALLRQKIREIAETVPSAVRVLNLYRYYTLGGGACAKVRPLDPDAKPDNQVTKRATAKLRKRLRENERHLSFAEMVRRLYRDGELFIRRIPDSFGKYEYRFVDPENVCDQDGNEIAGVKTDPNDTVVVTGYTLSRQKFDQAGNPDGYETYADVSADDMIHIAVDKDSTVKRGKSRLYGCLEALRKYRTLILNEVTLRERQSAIVMVRKVAGGSSAARSVLDAAKTATSEPVDAYSGQERYRAGTVATTTKGVEISFAHPDNNFSDAGPLFSLLDREVAKVTGFTFEQISCNSSEGNLASALTATSPTLQMLKEERQFLSVHLERYFMWLLEDATLTDAYCIDLEFAPIETIDKLKDAQAGNIGVLANAISRKELARRLDADPEQMRAEIEEESKLPYINTNYANQNPSMADKATSSAGNAAAGGTNQGGSPGSGNSDPGKQGTM